MSNFERDMANTMLDAADARIASLEADKADLLRVLGVADERIRSGEDARGQYIRENAALEARCRELEAALHQAPIARVIVTDDAPAAVIIYAPGLPLGEHDLYCEPTASETATKPICDCADGTCRPTGTHNFRCRRYFKSETACEHEWEAVKVTGDNGVIYNCKKCGGTQGWNPGAAVETWETVADADEVGGFFDHPYYNALCSCVTCQQERRNQAKSETAGEQTKKLMARNDTGLMGTEIEWPQPDDYKETTVKPICATCDDWHDSGYYNHNFVPKPETAGKPSRMCPECHAVGGPDGVTICATCVSGWWEQGCEHCGSLEINPKCPACNGIER